MMNIKEFYTKYNISENQLNGKDIYGGSLYLEGCTLPEGLKLPETIGGYLYIEGCTETIGGYLYIEGCTLPEGLKLPETIGDSLYLRGCTLPEGLKLPETIGGSLYLRGCTLPEGLKLPETIGGSLDLKGCTLPEGLKLPETIGGSLDLNGCTLPEGLKLPETIGGYLYLEGCTLPEGLKLPETNKTIPLIKWGKGNGTHILCDDRFSEVISKKGNIWKLKDVGRNNEYFLVTDGNGKYAHGNSIKEAKDDLIYKISNRDKSKYKNLDINTKLSFTECIEMYRVITGACSTGVKNFIESKGIKKSKFSPLEISNITKGAYGNSDFNKFFNVQ